MRTKGFTIVELLIVIVIIAILAAITIVAYNGIQKRARNQQMVTAAKEVYKAISAYVIDNGTYPVSGSVSCVGDGYPADAAGLCWTGQSSLAANALLQPYFNGTIPKPPMERLGNSARGLLINASSGNFEFTIIGETTCPSIGAPTAAPAVSGSDLWCRVRLPALN